MSSKKDGIIGFVFIVAAAFAGGYWVGSSDEQAGIERCWDESGKCVEMYESPSNGKTTSLMDGSGVNCLCIHKLSGARKECHHDRLACDDVAERECERRHAEQYNCGKMLQVLTPKVIKDSK